MHGSLSAERFSIGVCCVASMSENVCVLMEIAGERPLSGCVGVSVDQLQRAATYSQFLPRTGTVERSLSLNGGIKLTINLRWQDNKHSL